MDIQRLYTKPAVPVFTDDDFRTVTRENRDYIVPAVWDDRAVDVLVDHIFLPDPVPAADDAAQPVYETDIRDVLHRVCGFLSETGLQTGVFATADQAQVFYDECRYMMLHRIFAPEIALWAAGGVAWAYGIERDYTPAERIDAFATTGAAPTAISILPDTTATDLLRRVRHVAGLARLDNGGRKVVVTMPVEHADSRDFIAAQATAEADAVTRDFGRRPLRDAAHRIMDACDRDSLAGFDPAFNLPLRQEIALARGRGVPDGVIRRAIDCARDGDESFTFGADDFAEVELADDGMDFAPVISVPDSFMESALTGHGFMQVADGAAYRHVAAPAVLDDIAAAIWRASAPQVLFRGNIAAGAGRSASGGLIYTPASAPSGTVNLAACAHDVQIVDTDKFLHAVTVAVYALDIAHGDVAGADRPVVLGLAGMAETILAAGVDYMSATGHTVAGLCAAVLTGQSLAVSAALADRLGAYDGYADVSAGQLKNMRDKIAFLSGAKRGRVFDVSRCPDENLCAVARRVWTQAYDGARGAGLRHGHVTGFAAPAAVQALLGTATRNMMRMDDILMRGTGATDEIYARRVHPAAVRALRKCGYGAGDIDRICLFAAGHGSLFDAPVLNHDDLRTRGFDDDTIALIETRLETAEDARHAFYDVDTARFGITAAELAQANRHVAGTASIATAPLLNDRHRAIFAAVERDTIADPQEETARQAAIECFISGGVAHHIVVPHDIAARDVKQIILSAWEKGVRQISIWRRDASLLLPVVDSLAGTTQGTVKIAAAPKKERRVGKSRAR